MADKGPREYPEETTSPPVDHGAPSRKRSAGSNVWLRLLLDRTAWPVKSTWEFSYCARQIQNRLPRSIENRGPFKQREKIKCLTSILRRTQRTLRMRWL